MNFTHLPDQDNRHDAPRTEDPAAASGRSGAPGWVRWMFLALIVSANMINYVDR